jgi:voltage-gated potassium channel Kch
VVLADSEYRHEIETDIEPFKGLLLGLFFISVGAEIDFHLLVDRPLLIAGLLFGAIALKLGSMYLFARLFGLDKPARVLTAFALAQVGEFAFVLISTGQESHVFGPEVAKPLVTAVALSMLATPALFLALERWVLPRVAASTPKRAHDEVVHDGAAVVMAGFGRVGQVVGRMVRLAGYPVTVLDLDPAIVDMLRRLGQRVYYGDASRLDLLYSAGCEHAKLFVLAIDEPEKSVEVAELVRRHFPKLPILARARNRQHYYRLRKLGITQIYRETLGTSLELGQGTLRQLGVRAHTAHRIAHRWRQHDEAALEDMLQFVGQGDQVWLNEAKKALANFEKSMADELGGKASEKDPGWDNESLRDEINARYARNARPPPS